MGNNVVGFWNEKKEKLKQKFPSITNRDLRFRLGNEKEMIEMLGNKLKKTSKELLNIIITL